MRIIFAIDIIDGKCVRLEKGDLSTKKVYNGDPLDLVKQAADNGLKHLHLVDLEGAAGLKPVSFRLLEKIASHTSLAVDFGGGLRSTGEVITAFDAGAYQVTCGSIAITNPELFLAWLGKWGQEKIILGADCRDRKVVTHGWTMSSSGDIKEFAEGYVKKGINYITCTDVEKDGMLGGPALELYRELQEISGIKLIASGGISSLKHIEELTLAGCDGAIIGKAIYEGKISLNELGRIC
jgi:phosphoribosylformimino-5-aminoimidazole carboxamide ribotide isomerase